MVMVGAFSKIVELPEELFIEAIKRRIKSRFIELNIEAFKKGRESI
jgi:Pyruvate/2-oxoacid:ferredoxin oxidoreductase gamma subunit